MNARFLRALPIAAVLLAPTASLAGEPIKIDYQYTGDTGVNLSSIAGGPLVVASFTDTRSIVNKQDIDRPGKEALTLEDQSATHVLEQAFIEAFLSSGAQVSDTGSLQLHGNLLEMQVNETAGGLEVVIRCELNLHNQGRNAWQSVVFSRTQTAGDNINTAIGNGLNRLINELFMDDYFLMELGIF